MKKTYINCLITVLCFALCSQCFNPALYSQVTKTYRQGVNGYTSCKSVDISDLNLQGTNNGTSFGDGNNDWCIGKLHGVPGMGYDSSPLLRFDSLGIPAGSQVTSASLTVTLMMWSQPSCRVIGRYLNQQWYGNIIDSAGGVSNAPVGWQRRLPNTPWSINGALGEETDLIAGKYFVLPPDSSLIPQNGYITYTVPIDVQVVQSWINNPAVNNGFKFQCDALNVHIYIVQPQRPDVSKRPLLSITYTTPQGISGNEIPAEFSLSQNFPNPFNPGTTIYYSIPRISMVKITVFNALGEVVKKLVDENKSAGNYEINFDASGLSSGFYFYRMDAVPESGSGFSDVKKMLVVK